MNSWDLLTGAAIGLLATLVMDIAGSVGIRIGLAGSMPRRTGPHLIGRWFGYMLRGKFTHGSILDTPPLPGEPILGLVVHYSIGTALGLIYTGLLAVLHSAPAVANAVIFGIVTTVVPWLYLYPVWGYGWLGADAKGVRMTYFALYSHAAFGLGIALWGALLSRG